MATPSWLYISQLTGNSGTTRITVSADTNYNLYSLITDVFVETDNTGLQGDTVIVQMASGDSIDSYANEYLTIEILSATTNDYIAFFRKNSTISSAQIQYSKNGGEWNYLNSSLKNNLPYYYISVSNGDIIKFKCKNIKWENYYLYSETNIKVNVYGNIMSLLYEDEFSGQTTISNNNFMGLFTRSLTNLDIINAKNLVLPATTFPNNCYRQMFARCTNLRNAPALPATTLNTYCYCDMFSGCTSLVTAPELPAKNLANYCYDRMFEGCTSLRIAPELPATKLSSYCYFSMFRNCSSLTTAPDLPASALTSYCYQTMFYGCTNLNYIKCLAKRDLNSAGALSNWVNGVASSGTFVKASGVSWSRGNNGIPNNWIVQEE